MFYFYVLCAQRILQRTPRERKWSIMHAIKYVYPCLCLFNWSTLIFLFSPRGDLRKKKEKKLKDALPSSAPAPRSLRVFVGFGRSRRHPVWHHRQIPSPIRCLAANQRSSSPPTRPTGTFPFGTSEYRNPSAAGPPGCLTADWWSCITR